MIDRNLVLGLGFILGFAACDDATGLDNVSDAAVEQGVRFQAVANQGDDPNNLTVRVELFNTSSAPRNLLWGGCGIEIRLYRSNSRVYDSQIAGGACEDIGHSAVAHPAQIKELTELIRIDPSRIRSGHYDVTMVFTGRIDNAGVALEVRAGSINL
jgi:hypothetical protein